MSMAERLCRGKLSCELNWKLEIVCVKGLNDLASVCGCAINWQINQGVTCPHEDSWDRLPRASVQEKQVGNVE